VNWWGFGDVSARLMQSTEETLTRLCGRFRGRVCEVCVDFGFGGISCHAIIRSPVVSEKKKTPDWDCLQANNVDFFQNPQFDLLTLDP
jgi:hypothetical protein